MFLAISQSPEEQMVGWVWNPPAFKHSVQFLFGSSRNSVLLGFYGALVPQSFTNNDHYVPNHTKFFRYLGEKDQVKIHPQPI